MESYQSDILFVKDYIAAAHWDTKEKFFCEAGSRHNGISIKLCQDEEYKAVIVWKNNGKELHAFVPDDYFIKVPSIENVFNLINQKIKDYIESQAKFHSDPASAMLSAAKFASSVYRTQILNYGQDIHEKFPEVGHEIQLKFGLPASDPDMNWWNNDDF